MPELRYAAIEVGDPIGPESFEITDEIARDHHEAMGADHPAFGADSDLVEPTFLGPLASAAMGRRYTGDGTIYVQGDFEFFSPLRVGQTVIVEGEFSDKFEKRGRKYVELDVEHRTDEGTDLGRTVLQFVIEADR